MFLDFYEVNFGTLQLFVNVPFQVRHVSTATISLRSACTPPHSAICVLVCFFLIMFSFALNEWTLCTQIVISQDTAHWGAGCSSRSPSADKCTDLAIYQSHLTHNCLVVCLDLSFPFLKYILHHPALATEQQLESENLKRQILLSDPTRWPATPAHPFTALTQRCLSSQFFECRLNSTLTKCVFRPPSLVSGNKLCEPISIMTEVWRQRLLKARVMKRQLRRLQSTVAVRWTCNPHRINLIVTIQSSVYLNSTKLHAHNHHSSTRCDMTSHYVFILL